eukprot:1951248-Alexandrium_andersonii.AAC.1
MGFDGGRGERGGCIGAGRGLSSAAAAGSREGSGFDGGCGERGGACGQRGGRVGRRAGGGVRRGWRRSQRPPAA